VSFFSQVRIVLRKEILMESRGAEVTLTSGFFAILVVVLSSLSSYTGRAATNSYCAGVIWLSVAFAAVLSIARSWAREREGAALEGLLTTAIRPSALFLGKAVSLLLFLGAIEAVVIPLAALFFSVDLLGIAFPLLIVCGLVTPGVSAVGTLFGAMTAKTSVRDLVLSIVLFPLLAPVLLTAIAATRALLAGDELVSLGGYLRLLVLFDAAFIALGTVLFGTLIDD
jgi:heme exporter protein B